MKVCTAITALLAMAAVEAFSISFSQRRQYNNILQRQQAQPSSSLSLQYVLLQQRRCNKRALHPLRESARVDVDSTDVQQSVEGGGAATKSGGKSDEGEWRAILASFKMYKAAYGDLKVPSRFVVPSMPPWPESGWGLKLGTKVAAIRSTGKYVENDDGRRQILDDIGFLWRLRSPSPDKKMDGVKFEQIYDALVQYKKEFGNLDVPITFSVPDIESWPQHSRGLPLGSKLATIRSKTYLKNRPEQRKKLEELGLQLDGKVAANSARYHLVYDALVRYKEIYGDLLVPQPFVVPKEAEDWNEPFWGLRLGARVNAIRSQGTFVNTDPSRREELSELGFVWEQPADGKRRGRRKKSMEVDATLNGLMSAEKLDPSASSSTSSGVASASSASAEISAEDDIFSSFFQTDELSKVGASGLQPLQKDSSSSKNGPSLTDASAVIANQMMKTASSPQSMKKGKQPATVINPIASVATDALKLDLPDIIDRDLENMDGIELKDVWHLLTPDEQEDSQRDDNPRENIDWQFDDYDGYSLDDILEALKHYHGIHNNFDIEPLYVVPTFDAESAAAAAAALAAMEEDNDEGAALLGLDVDDEDALMGDLRSQSGSGEEWPALLQGMRLGNIVSRMRSGDVEVRHVPERKAMFDEIGFDWGDDELFIGAPFEKFLCGLWVYYQIRGDACVDLEFRIPDEEPWPEALAHFPLGHAMNFVRHKKDIFWSDYRAKWRSLYRFDFLWLPAVEDALQKPYHEHYLEGLEQ
uniref:Helicase-associated domain-containing protein n=1 Tax=Leptocylindrus danicus TaxID=163516 RepID=A0A7S2JR57_9STRA|mmetsp:Transcript_1059/g.1515  ORF Transcript_1059/g.1515 Transcript_1059/m.1515 type:complete len:755 (+) Transcript_1059:342-2606(+)